MLSTEAARGVELRGPARPIGVGKLHKRLGGKVCLVEPIGVFGPAVEGDDAFEVDMGHGVASRLAVKLVEIPQIGAGHKPTLGYGA